MSEVASESPNRAPLAVGALIAVGFLSFAVGSGGTLLVHFFVLPDGPKPTASAAAVAPPPPPPQPALPAPSASVRIARAEPSPEADAKAALTRLREGIGACVRNVIGILPGTSPPVPPSLALLKTGTYQSNGADWKSPVFACTAYRETNPQSFQIQWQLSKVPTEGTGVAWIDENKDGKPDRAFGFRATLKKKKEVTLSDIVPLVPIPAVLPGK